jgi:ribosomal protein S18 acetylase RimI-like enzyme
MTKPYQIRTAQGEDAEALAALLARVFRATYGSRVPDEILKPYLERVFDPNQVAKEIALAPHLHLLASSDDVIVGTAQLALAPPEGHDLPNSIELARLYVEPSFHGKGVAEQLLLDTFDQIRRLGFTRVWLCAWQENPRALAFYRKHGFEAFGEIPVFVDGVRFDDILLQRTV